MKRNILCSLLNMSTRCKGTVSFNGNEMESDRTTTTEINEVGTTKVAVPEEAKKKLT